MTDRTEDPLTRAADVLVRFFRHLDDSDYEALASLLDGEWHRQGKVLTGRDAVLAALSTRSPTRRIHHLLTNICGEDRGGDVALTAYMLVVQHDAGTPIDGPAPLAGLASIRTLRARAAGTPDGWRIRWLKSDPPTFAA
ncbi:nuclear transport factor 2 family protein [Pseudooceanicola sp. LIPI14-2-Ac024]|uniref:nuclear transport factor 2 family protein n=1 Tax=Pseudooceanicola sp. LIPI14-2-Ac024 TaxID=3344875 RepID=UPI0035CFC1F1